MKKFWFLLILTSNLCYAETYNFAPNAGQHFPKIGSCDNNADGSVSFECARSLREARRIALEMEIAEIDLQIEEIYKHSALLESLIEETK